MIKILLVSYCICFSCRVYTENCIIQPDREVKLSTRGVRVGAKK